MAEWIVRLPEKTVMLPANITSIEVIHHELFEDMVPTITDLAVREKVESDMCCIDDPNFWVCIRYNAVCVNTAAMVPQFTVLCGTTSRIAADRIVDMLFPVMFSGCEYNNIIDFRTMLNADMELGIAAVKMMTAANEEPATPPVGRFVDLDDNGVSSATIPRKEKDATVNTAKLLKKVESAGIAVVVVAQMAEPAEVERSLRVDRARSLIREPMHAITVPPALQTVLTPAPRQVVTPEASFSDMVHRSGWTQVQSVGRGVPRHDAPMAVNEAASMIVAESHALRERSVPRPQGAEPNF